jgi:hypothetical protein
LREALLEAAEDGDIPALLERKVLPEPTPARSSEL